MRIKRRSKQEFEDYLNTAEVKDFFFRVERELMPKVEQSGSLFTVFTGMPDARQALELGAAVFLDKPIILAVVKGAKVPENLRKCAHTIIELSGEHTGEDHQKMLAALRPFQAATEGE